MNDCFFVDIRKVVIFVADQSGSQRHVTNAGNTIFTHNQTNNVERILNATRRMEPTQTHASTQNGHFDVVLSKLN